MKEKNKLEIIAIGLLGLLILAAAFIGVVFESVDVEGATNLTTVTRVLVGNTPPNLTNVIVTPSSIDLAAGNATIVNCTGYAWDYNGWDDINVTNATFYDITVSSDGDSNDRNYHYTNSSCGLCRQYENSDTNASCSCLFNVWYYANNGTSWICNMSIQDKGGDVGGGNRMYFNDTLNSSVATINPVLGIDVPPMIDYGSLSITEISSFIARNVTNYGNIPMNISVRGWGGDIITEDNWAGNYSMFCDVGNISMDYQRYSLNTSVTYANMTNLTNTSIQMPDLPLWARTNDTAYGNDTNPTYWRIQIPADVAGSCNGTVEFLAIER